MNIIIQSFLLNYLKKNDEIQVQLLTCDTFFEIEFNHMDSVC